MSPHLLFAALFPVAIGMRVYVGIRHPKPRVARADRLALLAAMTWQDRKDDGWPFI